MNSLFEDGQIMIMSYLKPKEIISFYNSCDQFQTIVNELAKHIGFVVKCYEIVDQNLIDWFQKQDIRLRFCNSYECRHGHQYWYRNGKLHRDNDLPAIIYSNGTCVWFQNGRKYREGDQPAAIYADGTQHWYKNGRLHRYFKNGIEYK